LALDDPDGRDLCLRLAAALGEIPAISVHELSPSLCIRQAFGNTKDIKQPPPKLMTIQPGVGIPVDDLRYEAKELSFESVLPTLNIEDLGLVAQNPNEISLKEAAFIMAAGNGIKDWHKFNVVSNLFQATRAATRVVCDAGHMTRDCQVGASGHLVQADCYLALGISGAIQHLQGIEKCNRVIAVNTDANAPIMKRADLAIVGDANRILEEILVLLEGGS